MRAIQLAANRSPAQIARASGSNFLVSFLFLSPGRRRGLLALYAFCRVVDDAVDLEASEGRETAEEHLAFWEEELGNSFSGNPKTPLGFALHRAGLRFGLDPEPLRELCLGVRMDLAPKPFEDFEALKVYMHRVASAVGIACLPIFGANPTVARPYAEALGLALQYTNILRDVREDGLAGRCYLPLDQLKAFGLSPEKLRSPMEEGLLLKGSPLESFLNEEFGRARSLYQAAARALPPKQKKALKPARIMGRIYEALLDQVEKKGPKIFVEPKVRVPKWKKLWLALSTLR
jgi:phytoene synthase